MAENSEDVIISNNINRMIEKYASYEYKEEQDEYNNIVHVERKIDTEDNVPYVIGWEEDLITKLNKARLESKLSLPLFPVSSSTDNSNRVEDLVNETLLSMTNKLDDIIEANISKSNINEDNLNTPVKHTDSTSASTNNLLSSASKYITELASGIIGLTTAPSLPSNINNMDADSIEANGTIPVTNNTISLQNLMRLQVCIN